MSTDADGSHFECGARFRGFSSVLAEKGRGRKRPGQKGTVNAREGTEGGFWLIGQTYKFVATYPWIT